MSNLIDLLRENIPTDIFTDVEVRNILPGTPDQRYGLVKRAISSGAILRIRRGLYCLGKKHRRQGLSLFALAQKIYAPSYVSLESALSYHGWIPEATFTVTSISAGRSKEIETPAGTFSYARDAGFNLTGVTRIEKEGATFFMAEPIKALADYVSVAKAAPQDPLRLAESLRIDRRFLHRFPRDLIDAILRRQSTGRTARFLKRLKRIAL